MGYYANAAPPDVASVAPVASVASVAPVAPVAPSPRSYSERSTSISLPRDVAIGDPCRLRRWRGVRYATRAGATATFTFSGSSVTWYGPVGPTRGRARVSVDGKLVRTVDLRSSSFTARKAVFSQTWTAAAKHTLVIEVVGTARHPYVAHRRVRRRRVSRRRSARGGDLDLDPVVRGQGGHADRRPGRGVRREVRAVDRVHRREVGEVAQVDRAAHHVAMVEPDDPQQPPTLSSIARVSASIPPGTAPWTPGSIADLAGKEHEAVRLHDLGERAGRPARGRAGSGRSLASGPPAKRVGA